MGSRADAVDRSTLVEAATCTSFMDADNGIEDTSRGNNAMHIAVETVAIVASCSFGYVQVQARAS